MVLIFFWILYRPFNVFIRAGLRDHLLNEAFEITWHSVIFLTSLESCLILLQFLHDRQIGIEVYRRFHPSVESLKCRIDNPFNILWTFKAVFFALQFIGCVGGRIGCFQRQRTILEQERDLSDFFAWLILQRPSLVSLSPRSKTGHETHYGSFCMVVVGSVRGLRDIPVSNIFCLMFHLLESHSCSWTGEQS